MAFKNVSPDGIAVSRRSVSGGKGKVLDLTYDNDLTHLERYPNSEILTWPIRAEIGPAEFVIGLRSLLGMTATRVSLHETEVADPIFRDIAPKRMLGWLRMHEVEVAADYQVVELEDPQLREALFWQRPPIEGGIFQGSFNTSHLAERPIDEILATTGSEATTARSQQLAELILKELM